MEKNTMLSITIIILSLIIFGLIIFESFRRDGKIERYVISSSQNLDNISGDVLKFEILPHLDLKDLNEFAAKSQRASEEIATYLTNIYGGSPLLKDLKREKQQIAIQIDSLKNQLSQTKQKIKENQTGLPIVNRMMYYYQEPVSEKGLKYLKMLEEIFTTIGAKYVSLFRTKTKGEILVVDYSNIPFVYSEFSKRDRTLPIALRVGPWEFESQFSNAKLDTSIISTEDLNIKNNEIYKNIFDTIQDIMLKYNQDFEVTPEGPAQYHRYGSYIRFGVLSKSKNNRVAYPNQGYNLFHSEIIGKV